MNIKNRNNMKPNYIFEISWEICNKVGGIYTVLASKAKVIQEQFNDNYILIGPDVWKETTPNPDFIEEPDLLSDWKAAAWNEGLKVRTGRWNIAGKPIVILVDFTPLFSKKDDIFTKLWEGFKLDSLHGQWDYIESAMFGYAAGHVVESLSHFRGNSDLVTVAHFHEWMTATGILYLKTSAPQIGTVFTTHATALGRSIAGNGYPLYENLKNYDTVKMAEKFNVRSKNSLETIAAQQADSFTTVSNITALECKQFYNKKPDEITINGFDEHFIPKGRNFTEKRVQARKKALEIASKLTEKTFADDTFLIINSGRYEFRNKGIDLYIKTLGEINKNNETDKDIVAFIAVPAGHGEVNRVFTTGEKAEGTSKYLTHYLWNPQEDPTLQEAIRNGLNNTANDKVTLVFLPAYLDGKDGVANYSYYDFLIGFDLSVFPSYYEPWGYTPMESIAFKVPTITTSFAGFGEWITKHYKVKHEAVTVIHREEGKDELAINDIKTALLHHLSAGNNADTKKEAEAISKQLQWNKLAKHYFNAWNHAAQRASGRATIEAPSYIPQTRQVDVSIQKDRPQWKKILIKPVLPKELEPLKELAYNLWWSWNTEASELFASILPDQWETLEFNPVKLLEQLSSFDHKRLMNSADFMKNLRNVHQTFKAYMTDKKNQDKTSIAYFSMEYGLHVSLKIYSGGLGILAGDYLKQASDSNKNFMAVGLLYRYGYFKQKITYSGDQIAESIPQKFTQLPLIPVRNSNGEWITVKIALPGRSVIAKAWQVNVGRIPLYLLDTDIEENTMEDRTITHLLYGGDREYRLKQELLLGLGGIRLIDKLNKKPDVFHSNEGHSAFIGLERLKNLMEEYKLDFESAKEVVKASTLFTTHTPVPA
ncbi:MAG: alpha-glucan family phosphorylase, partial [Bacteroidetes bacterium]